VRHARLARISSWIRRSRQVTPQPVEDNVFGPNLNQVKRQPVPSPVASPCRRRVDARRWRETTSWDAGCRPRVRLGQNHFQGQRNNNPKKELLDKVTFGFVVGFFFFLRGAQRLGPSMFPSTAPETRLQDCLACKPCTGYGLGQRLGRYSRGAIPDRIGTKTNIACLHRLRRPKGWAGG